MNLQRIAVVEEALSWQRTPYHHMGDIKGVGTDCAMFLVRVYASQGLVPPDLDPRPYAPEWHLHHSEELYVGWLDQYATLIGGVAPNGEAFGSSPKSGDVCLYRFGRCYSHGAILVEPGTVIHSYLKQGVVQASTEVEPLVGRACKFYTLWPGATP